MRRLSDPRALGRWLGLHAVEVTFVLIVAFWLGYAISLSRHFYFWSDDLRIIQQSSSFKRMFEPYNQAFTLPTMVVDRVSAEIAGLTYTPFVFSGPLFLIAPPLAYFFTARRQLGPALAGVLAVMLLWFDGVSLRQAGLNHYCALAAGMVCATALNRGRRADGILFASLLFSLASGGAGLVVAGAVLLHNAMTRAPWRRWLVSVVPLAVYGVWLLVDGPLGSAKSNLALSDKVLLVRDFFLAPFYQVGFKLWPVAALLVIAFFAWGLLQLRHGLVAGANFVVWTSAMLAWPIGLIYSRGTTANVATFRYVYVELGIGLLAVVPRRPIRWPESLVADRTRWLAAGVAVVALFGGVRALDARSALQDDARRSTQLGRNVKGTMLVLRLGPGVIPDSTPLRFFGFNNPHGTAGQVRTLMARYGSPLEATTTDIDRQLVALRAAKIEPGSRRRGVSCTPLTRPTDFAPTSLGEVELGQLPPGVPKPTGPVRYRVYAAKTTVIELRRFGTVWVRLGSVPGVHYAYLTLPVLASQKPWTIRAKGLCMPA